MSRVDNWMLLGWLQQDDEEPKPVDKLNVALEDRFPGCGRFVRVDNRAGGSKYIESDVFMLATNCVDADAMLAVITAHDWENGSDVQLLFKGSEDYRWRIAWESEK